MAEIQTARLLLADFPLFVFQDFGTEGIIYAPQTIQLYIKNSIPKHKQQHTRDAAVRGILAAKAVCTLAMFTFTALAVRFR